MLWAEGGGGRHPAALAIRGMARRYYHPLPWHVRLRNRLRRWTRIGCALLIILVALWAVWRWPDGAREQIAPPTGLAARAVDGDSLELPGGHGLIAVRLEGIDAPEYRQTCLRDDGTSWPCGAEAYAALSALVLEPGLNCGIAAQDRYRRRIARCRSAQTADFSAILVERGLAVATGRGDDLYYRPQQDRAEAARRGLWQGRFDAPADWRRTHPR